MFSPTYGSEERVPSLEAVPIAGKPDFYRRPRCNLAKLG
jgi:hypothetical protein